MSSQDATAAAIGAVKAPTKFEDALMLSAFYHSTEYEVPEWQRDVLEEVVVKGSYAQVLRARGADRAALERTVGDLIEFMKSWR